MLVRPVLHRELLRGALAVHLVAARFAQEHESAAASAARSAARHGVADSDVHGILVRRVADPPRHLGAGGVQCVVTRLAEVVSAA